MAGATLLTAERAERRQDQVATGRLLVTRQDPSTRLYHCVGFVDGDPEGFTFRYLARVRDVVGFRPLLGFPELSRTYHAKSLFPIFSQRVLRTARPDRAAWLEALDLAQDAPELEILARSGGRRAGDTIELLPVPAVNADGRTSTTFLVHGVRHVHDAAARIDALRPGDRLRLVEDSGNPQDPRALLVSAASPVGYVPGPLLDYVHAVRRAGGEQIVVVRTNPASVGPHLRLLVQLDGRWEEPEAPFTGPAWETA